jgi:serine/threonine-protein kinase
MAQMKFLKGEWSAVSRRLDEALALAPAERGAWLAALDAGDASAGVKRQLRELLQAAAGVETADFLESLPRLTLEPQAARPDPNAPAPGMSVGPYRLVRELGVGGMGSVWLAERTDGGLKRPVALKLPQLSWSGNLAQRLQRERDILASLDHPNIARIYDAGIDALGRPYLALEFVDGQTIDDYCRARALAVSERIALLLQVARAVAHAHARLVVHRDLKPANILVTSEGQVRLLDFGIAKLLEEQDLAEGSFTLQGGRALTPDYASPEQIRGEGIGTASDVYSLGVVAYELLTGKRPYHLPRRGAAALGQAIAAVELPAASAVATDPAARRALQGDLDAILNKALKPDPADRYASIEAMAQDIERHQSSQPVLARPDAAGYHLRRFVRRNRLAVAASAAVSLALIAGLAAAAWQARAAQAQAERAEQVKAFTLSIFDDADATSEAGTKKTAADLLLAARQRVATEMVGRPDVAVELMTAIGTAMVGHGLTAEAEALLREATSLAAQHLGAQHPLARAAQVALGEAQVELGQHDAAVATLQPAIDGARRDGDIDTLNAGLRWQSTAYFNAGRLPEGVAAASAAVASLSLQRRSGKPLTPRDTMLTHQAYADALGQVDAPGAVAAARVALAAAHAIYGDKVVPSVLDIRTMLGLALVTEGPLEEGLRELEAVLPATVALLGPTHARVSKLAHLVGNAKLSAGDVPGAIVAYRQSMEVEDAQQGADAAFGRGMSRFFLGSAEAAARRPDNALPLLEQAVDLLRAAQGPTSARTLRAASARAWQLAEAGRLTDADQAFEALAAAPWSATDAAGHQRRLAILRSLQGRHAQALELAQRASATLSQSANRNLQARGLLTLGQVQLEAGDARQALVSLQAASALFAGMQSGVSPERADTQVAIGRAQLQLGDTRVALQSLTAADAAWQRLEPANRHAALARLHLARALWAQGDKVAGQTALRQSAALLGSRPQAADEALLKAVKQQFAS